MAIFNSYVKLPEGIFTWSYLSHPQSRTNGQASQPPSWLSWMASMRGGGVDQRYKTYGETHTELIMLVDISWSCFFKKNSNILCVIHDHETWDVIYNYTIYIQYIYICIFLINYWTWTVVTHVNPKSSNTIRGIPPRFIENQQPRGLLIHVGINGHGGWKSLILGSIYCQPSVGLGKLHH